jgi:glycine/D-amino acid oxidase-like deaminating enzyme
VSTAVRRSWTDARSTSFWLDRPDAPPPAAPLDGDTICDLAVIGGGFTGLWTALLAKEADPERDVLLVEQRSCGWAASGRNGGFCASSLTHGLRNGAERFPDEIAHLERLGRANLDELEAALLRHDIDCDFQRAGELEVATAEHQVPWLHEDAELVRHYGGEVEVLDAAEVRRHLDSPTFVAANWYRDGRALVDPARLAWGLRRACESLGVRIGERTRAEHVSRDRAGVAVRTAAGTVRARQVVLATNAFPALLHRLRPYTVPVYDYVLTTEPLSREQLDSIGWCNRQGVSDLGNQFHYYRLTADDRILWGGYDAVYHWRNGLRDELDCRPRTFDLLAAQFFDTFPQLAGLQFTHAWGGAIDTCTRFFAFQGAALGGRVAYSLGYTGLGVAATRFGAQVVLDLLAGHDTERTRLRAPQHRPIPFPPEPIRYAGITMTRRALARADERQGQRGPWLQLLDRLGMGFDS